MFVTKVCETSVPPPPTVITHDCICASKENVVFILPLANDLKKNYSNTYTLQFIKPLA